MAAVHNYAALHFDTYAPLEAAPGVRKYLLINSEQDTVLRAVKQIARLLEDNPQFVPTFNPQVVAQVVSAKPYLTINRLAVCIASEKEAPPEAPREYKDRFFSGALLEKPVSCTLGHSFEQERLEFWRQRQGNTCPENCAHPITLSDADPLVVDEGSQYDIGRFRESRRAVQQTEEQQAAVVEDLQRQVNKGAIVVANTTAILHAVREPNKLAIAGKTATIAAKTAALVAKFGGASAVGVVRFAEIGVPVISLVIGAVLAVYRYHRGDNWILILGEVASGVSACFPGIGTIVSLVIDSLLLSADLVGPFVGVRRSLDNKEAYALLGVLQTASKAEVDSAYRTQMLQLHDDKLSELSDYLKENAKLMRNLLNEAKGNIYRERKWS